MLKLKNKKNNLKKEYLINAKNKTIGNLMTSIIKILIKKNLIKINKIDIININYIKYTGKKFFKKLYYYHTGYPGGIKKMILKNIYKDKFKKILNNSIKKMIKKNKLRGRVTKKINFFKKKKYINFEKIKIINI